MELFEGIDVAKDTLAVALSSGEEWSCTRLTRSLADFAKMVESFDAHGVSFVAVTQQFNTTTVW